MTPTRMLPLAVLLTSLSLGPSPASAAPAAVQFFGVWHEDCWGCGITSGYADLVLYGTHSGRARATFTASSPPGLLCTFTGTAIGRIEGALDVDFTWTRAYFTQVVITFAGESTGNGRATFVPSTTVCGGSVDAFVEGQLVGI